MTAKKRAPAPLVHAKAFDGRELGDLAPQRRLDVLYPPSGGLTDPWRRGARLIESWEDVLIEPWGFRRAMHDRGNVVTNDNVLASVATRRFLP
jgi:hypothetical protein